MAYWLTTTPTHREFEVRDTIVDMGIFAWVPRKVDPKRIPGKRTPVGVVAPLLTNYLFLSVEDERWHELLNVRGLWPEMIRISPAYWERRLSPHIVANDAAHDERLAAIGAGKRLERFNDGDALHIILGGLTGQKAIFRGLVEDETVDFGLKLFAEVGSIGGKPITITLGANQVDWVCQ